MGSKKHPHSNNSTVDQLRVETPEAAQSGLNPKAVIYTRLSATSLWINTNKMVLLQTAQAFVFNLNAPQSSVCAQIVLDSVSQRSYVTN